jgi:hypothetical protein
MIFKHAGVVIAGLDPAIHQSSQKLLTKKMDARVKPAHDAPMESARGAFRHPQRPLTSPHHA